MQEIIILLIIICCIVIAESIAQYCVRKSKEPNCKWYFFFAIIGYTIVCYLLYYSYDHRSIGIINALWSALSIISITSIGIYFYHEKLYLWDFFGMILIIIGIYLIFIYGHQ